MPGRVDAIVDALFPKETAVVWPERVVNGNFPKVTANELAALCNRIPKGKAPGPDGVPDLVIKDVTIERPDIIRDVFNACLEEGVFPRPWKVAKLVLLRKGEKPLDNPSSYRPICLLNTVGKLFERLIKRRMEKHLQENEDLNDRQFGFRKGRSTVDAVKEVMKVVDVAGTGPLRTRKLCVVVALDVANAFNTAKWSRIVKALHEKSMPRYLISVLQNYLEGRENRVRG